MYCMAPAQRKPTAFCKLRSENHCSVLTNRVGLVNLRREQLCVRVREEGWRDAQWVEVLAGQA